MRSACEIGLSDALMEEDTHLIAIRNVPDILQTSIDNDFLNKRNCCVLSEAELRLPHPLKANGRQQVITQLGSALAKTRPLWHAGGLAGNLPACRAGRAPESGALGEARQEWITPHCERGGL